MFKKTHILVNKHNREIKYYLDANNPGYYLTKGDTHWNKGASSDYINRTYAMWDVVKCKPNQVVNK